MQNIPTKSILAIRPSVGRTSNDPLRYTHYWTGMVLDEARKRGYNVVDMRDELATGDHVIPRLRQMTRKGPVFILGSGHGHADEFTGQNLDVVFDEDTSLDLNGSPVYLMSCQTAKSLGQRLVTQNNASAFLGYSEDYLLTSGDIKDVEFDPTVQSFMQMFTVPALTMVWGGSMEDGMRNAMKTYDKWRGYYRSRVMAGGNRGLTDRLTMERLKHNVNALTMYGDDVYITNDYRKLNIEPILPPPDGVGYIKIDGHR